MVVLCLPGDSSVLMDLHRLSITRSVRHFPEQSWITAAFPCFIVVKSFTSLYILLFFHRCFQSHYTVLLSSLFRLFHAPPDVVFHFLAFLRSFRFESFLSQFSSFVAQIKNFCSYPRYFLLTMLPRISLAASVTAVLKVMIIESMSESSLFMMLRGANFPPIDSLEGFQRIGISQLFEVKLQSCVFWLADPFQTKVEGLHQQEQAQCALCDWCVFKGHN